MTCPGCNLDKPHYARGVCHVCHSKAWKIANPEKARAYEVAYYAANKDRIKAKVAAWAETHPERIRERSAAYRLTHRDLPGVWAKTHPEEKRILNQRRRALRGGVLSSLTVVQWEAIKTAYKGRCAYCGRRFQRLTQDHIIPITKGGGTVVSNIVPACSACNSQKHTGPPPCPVQPLMI